MNIKSLYIWGNFFGYMALFVTEMCQWCGAISGNTIPSLFSEFYITFFIPQWAYAVLMVFLYLWLSMFSIDMLRTKYLTDENRALDDIGVKVSSTEFLMAAGVISFCYECFIATSVLFGLCIPFLMAAFFVFSFHSKGRTKMEKYVWSVTIAFLLIWDLYFFVASMSIAIEYSGNSSASGATWFYIWTTVLAFIILITYNIMSPSILASLFSCVIFVGIAVKSHSVDTSESTYAFILAFVPLSITLLCYFLTICCK